MRPDLVILDGELAETIGPSCHSGETPGAVWTSPKFDDSIYRLVLGALASAAMFDPSHGGAIDDYLETPCEPAALVFRLALAEARLRRRNAWREREAALRDSAELLSLAMSGALDGFWHSAVSPGGNYFDPQQPVWYSPQMQTLMGFPEGTLPPVLESWASRLHPEDRDRVFGALEDHIERRVPFDSDYRLRVRSGEYRWFNGRGQGCWDSAGRPLRMAGSIHDITQRREAEDALCASEARHRLIAETVNDIIWTVRMPEQPPTTVSGEHIAETLAAARIEYVSPAIERLLGYTPHEACELSLATLLAPSAYENVLGAFTSHYSGVPDALTGAELGPLEIEHVTKSGESRFFEVTSVVNRDAAGRPAMVLGVSRDITERRRADQALRQERAFLQRLVEVHERERSLFAYEIHDGVMSRITAALLHLEASEAGRLLTPPKRAEFEESTRLLEIAGGEARRLISGLRPPILDEAGIVAAIEYLVNEHRSQLTDVAFTHQTQFDRLAPPLENAVFRLVQEALTNVCRHSGARRASVELAQTGDRLRITVRDWGMGFDPLATSESHFGLQGIRERARLLGGSARIESEPGAGTTITAEFPLPAS